MSDRVEELLARLTVEEKVTLVSGADMWTTPAIERVGIASLKMSDGPVGVRGSGELGTTSACFPCGSALGATWDPVLVGEVGRAMGEEAATKNVHVVLGPTVNIHRSALAGRNFECYSEDPYLTGRLAVAFIQGIQSTGVGATVKHFVCNDSEHERMTISSEVGERALREIYLAPFEAAVRQGGSWSVMSAYNRVNGTYACDHAELIGGVLKAEWGFDGYVVSDWWGTKSTAASARAGLDLEMPGPAVFWGDRLLAAVKADEVSEADLDDKVRRILGIAERTGALDAAPASSGNAPAAPASRGNTPADRHGAERSVDDPAHRRLARRAAVASMVLLKNEAGGDGHPVLPLEPGRLTSLAVVGPNADVARIMGGGSARVTPHYQVSPLEGLRAAAPEGLEMAFERGCVIDRSTPALDRRLIGPARVAFFANPEFAGEAVAEVEVECLEFTWFGAIHPEVVSDSFSARARALLTPRVSGVHVLSLTSAGRSRLSVDGAVVVDNWESQTGGTSYFGLGSAEVKASIDLVAGRDYEVVVEFAARKNWPMAGFIAGGGWPEPDDLMDQAVATAAAADAAIVVVGLNADWETEGRDRTNLYLAGRQDELVRRVAAANPNTVVVVNAGAPVAMDWAADVPAIVHIWYPGQELGNALADVVFGRHGPGGRLPTTFPRRLEDTPAFTNYPGESGRVLYGEGIFVGYRWYDKRDIEVLFPFGHGLDYTDFSYGALVVPAVVGSGADLAVRVEVTNTGSRRGTEVVQAYVSDLESSLARPVKELKAFAKVTLAPGETRTVDLVIEASALSFWDPGAHVWVAEAGDFEVAVGRSVGDIRARGRFCLSESGQRRTRLGPD